MTNSGWRARRSNRAVRPLRASLFSSRLAIASAGADDFGRLDFEAEGDARDRRGGWGPRSGRRAGEKAPSSTRSVRSLSICPWLLRSVWTWESRFHWFGSQTSTISNDQAGEDSCQRRRQGSPRSTQAPAEQGEGEEDREDRPGQHRVAGDDRQAGSGQEGEGEQGEQDGGDEPKRRAPAQQAEAEHEAAEAADHPRPLHHFAEPARDRRGRGRPGRSGGSAFRPFPGCRSASRAGRRW